MIVIEEQTSHLIWLECPFRIIRLATQESRLASGREIVSCEAGGGITLTEVDEKGVGPVCRSCDIPPSLVKKHACLYLVPFRVFREHDAQSYYACRWFLNIPPSNVPRNNDWCRGCSYWFPRPPENLIPDPLTFSRKALALFLSRTLVNQQPTKVKGKKERQ